LVLSNGGALMAEDFSRQPVIKIIKPARSDATYGGRYHAQRGKKLDGRRTINCL
jgi:hypothetical protein